MSDDHFLNLQPGTIVNGRYEIVKCLGTGSMGMVYACRHRELAGHMVAMKVLFSEVARDEIAAARFRNEIVAAYGVSHPNVVRAYEYFRDGDLIAFTMEYIGGGDLADRLNSDTPLEPDEIVDLLHQMCSGVQAIHDAGIIHRDLKPENILITSQGKIKITDFGIARTGTGPKLTEHGGVVGTIDYVSPEYLERGQVDGRSDIYALGVLAYEMLTGEAPFKGKSVIETMTMRLRMDPRPPHELRPECPEEVSRIILKALRRDPEERYQKAAEMQKDLFAFMRGVPSSALDKKDADGKDREESDGPAIDRAPQPTVSPESVPGLTSSGGGARDPLPSSSMAQGGDYASSRNLERQPSSSMGMPRQSTLTRMEAHINGELERAVEEANDAFYHVEQMESVLGNFQRPANFTPPPVDPSPKRNISVSQSSINVHRMSQLSHDMRGMPKSSGGIGPLVAYFVIVCLGFGVGFVFLESYFPSFISTNTFLQQFSTSKTTDWFDDGAVEEASSGAPEETFEFEGTDDNPSL